MQLCVFAVPALPHPAALPLLLRVRQRGEQRDPSPLEGGDAEAEDLPSTQRGEVEQRRQVRASPQLWKALRDRVHVPRHYQDERKWPPVVPGQV